MMNAMAFHAHSAVKMAISQRFISVTCLSSIDPGFPHVSGEPQNISARPQDCVSLAVGDDGRVVGAAHRACVVAPRAHLVEIPDDASHKLAVIDLFCPRRCVLAVPADGIGFDKDLVAVSGADPDVLSRCRRCCGGRCDHRSSYR